MIFQGVFQPFGIQITIG